MAKLNLDYSKVLGFLDKSEIDACHCVNEVTTHAQPHQLSA